MIYSLGNTKGARPEPGVPHEPPVHRTCSGPGDRDRLAEEEPDLAVTSAVAHAGPPAGRSPGSGPPGAQLGLGGGVARVAERRDSGGSPGNRGPRPARPALKGTAGCAAAEHQGSALQVREARWQSGAGRTWTRVLPALLTAAWPRSLYLHHITRIQAAF